MLVESMLVKSLPDPMKLVFGDFMRAEPFGKFFPLRFRSHYLSFLRAHHLLHTPICRLGSICHLVLPMTRIEDPNTTPRCKAQK